MNSNIVRDLLKEVSKLSKVETTQLLSEVVQENYQLVKAIEESAPKVEFYDDIIQSESEKDMSEIAKILNFKGFGRNKLFEFLRDKNILRNNNDPYQTFVDRKYFRIVENKKTLPYGETIVTTKTVVLQKGLEYIKKLLMENGEAKNE